MNGRNLFRSSPALRGWKTFAPAEAAVGATLVNDLPFPMSLRVNAKDSLAVLK